MNRQEFPADLFNESPSKEGLNIDIKRIVYRALQYWYIILLSLAIALIAAYLRNRYATRIYPVTASIIIKETQETSEGKLLYNNPLVSYYRNYLNELYIIRSYPLIQQVLEELNFGVSFYKEGNFLTTEAYDYIPFDARVVNDQGVGSRKFYCKPVDQNTFQLISNGNSPTRGEHQTFNFGDTLKFEGLDLCFTVRPDRDLNDYINQSFIFFYTNPYNLTGAYVGRLNVEWAEEGAGVINLSINGPNPTKEMDFIEGLIRNYQEYDLRKKSLTASRAIDFMTDQLSSISDSLRTVERQLEMFKDKNVVTDLSGEALRLYSKIETLESDKTELTVRNNYYDYLTNYIQQAEDLDQVILPSSIGVTDGVLVELVSKMIDLQSELKMVLSKEKLRTPIITTKERTLHKMREDILEAVKNQRGIDKIRLDFLNKSIQNIERQLGFLPVAEREFVSIKRNYTLLENLYLFLLQKRAEADISKASTTTDIAVVNPPMAGGAIAPKTDQNYIVAVILGLGLPLLAFVLLEVFNTRVQSKEDIEKLATIPFIGGVGHKKRDDNQEVLNHPKSAIAESFRALRSNLNYFIGAREKAVFLITSSISGEGKTFTSINLASVFALSGKKTLIVGADMRKPRLFDDFNLSNNVGLSSYLAGIIEFPDTIQKTSYATLDLVSGGPVPPNPSELLLTSRMDEFVKAAMAAYDYIIIDSPPLAIVTDAFVLSKYVDHTIFLVRQNYTPKALLKTAEEFYTSGKFKNISILLNDIYKSGPGYGYGYSYGYGYAYGYGYYGSKTRSGYYSDEDDQKRGFLNRLFGK